MKVCKKVCGECPFKKSSAPGYLGPHTFQDVFAYKQSEVPFTCHLQRSDDPFKNTSDHIDVCRGYIIWSVKSAHLFKDVELKSLQNEVDKTSKEFDSIMNLGEFIKHHKKV